MADAYNLTNVIDIADNKVGLKMFDKLSRLKAPRRVQPLDYHDYIPYNHRGMYDNFNLLIGDTYFVIPPEFIAVTSNSSSYGITTLRQENTQKEKAGYHTRNIIIDLVFNGTEQINGYKVPAPHIVLDKGKYTYDNHGVYYVDGLRQLLAQFKCTPILPICNELINLTYGIYTVALQAITISTVPGYPSMLVANVTLQEVNVFPYIEMPDISMQYMIDWDLFRFYYQSFLTEDHVYKYLQSVPEDKHFNRFKMSILNEDIFATTLVADSHATAGVAEKSEVNEYNILEKVCDPNNYITWIDGTTDNCYITEFQCRYSNILTNIQMSDMPSPTVQFLGGMDTIYNIVIETTNYEVIQAVEQCQISNDLITRNNAKLRSSLGFVKLESELVELTGSLFVMIDSITTSTVPGFPNLYNIKMQCVSYDIVQSERESLNGFKPFDCDDNKCKYNSFNMDNHVHKEQCIPNSQEGLWNKIQQDNYAEWKYRSTIELYPDMRLPKFYEVDIAVEAIRKFREENNLSPFPEKQYPHGKYPRDPIGMLGAINPDTPLTAGYADEEDAIIDYKMLDTTALEYDVYVNPDFYMFYCNDYYSSLGMDSSWLGENPIKQHETKTKTKSHVYYNDYNEDYSGDDVNSNQGIVEAFIAFLRKCIQEDWGYDWQKDANGYWVMGKTGQTHNGRRYADCSGFMQIGLAHVGAIPAECGTPGARWTHGLGNVASIAKNTEYFDKIPWDQRRRGDLAYSYGRFNHIGCIVDVDKNTFIDSVGSATNHGPRESTGTFNKGMTGYVLRPKAFKQSAATKTTNNKKQSDISNTIESTNGKIGYVTDEFLSMISTYEGFLAIATPADGGIDIGYGFHNTYYDGTKDVKIKPGMTMTRAEADRILKIWLETKWIPETISIIKSYGWDINEFTNNQVLALTSYFYNRGLYNNKAKAILNKANSPTIEAIGNNLINYWGSNVTVKRGLQNRRRAEQKIFFQQDTENGGPVIKQYKDPNTLTYTEYKSICQVVANLTYGEDENSILAMSQLIYDRLTYGIHGTEHDNNNKFGGLGNILSCPEFQTDTQQEISREVYDIVFDVFCMQKKYIDKARILYFLDTDAPSSKYDQYDEEYTSFGTIGNHSYWGESSMPSLVKFTIDTSNKGLGPMSQGTMIEQETLTYNHISLNNHERFGEPVITRCKYTRKKDSKEHWKNKVNSEENLAYTSFCNEYQYSRRATLLRAFPTYMFCILDDQCQWYDGKKLWTNYYSHQSVVDIQSHATNDMPVETVTITVNNSYHNLDRTQGGLSDYNIKNDPEIISGKFQQFWYKLTGGPLAIGGPKLTSMLIQLHQVIYAHARLREDARVHIKIGYGSDPLGLDTLINGHISDVSIGNQISMVVTSDGHELIQHIVSSKEKHSNNGFLGLFGIGAKQESSNIIANIMCQRSSWMSYLSSKWGEPSKWSIEHFGLFDRHGLLGNESSTNENESNNVDVTDIWDEYSEQYDILKNIYKANYNKESYHHESGISFDSTQLGFGNDFEKNVVFCDYNMTPWDVLQVCTQQVPEYICAPRYYQFDSRLYYGLKTWMEKYRYDIINGEAHEECKSSTQLHILDSTINIIDNQIRVSSRNSYTNCKVMYQLGKSATSTLVIHSDDTIEYAKQKTKILDTPILQDSLGFDSLNQLVYSPGRESARRVGISDLLIGWEQQYQGQILLMGHPGIRPHDIVMINDMYSNIFGIASVREVIHSFSSSTGYSTSIVPGIIGFSTDENSGLIQTCQNYLGILNTFMKYMIERRRIKNAYESNLILFAQTDRVNSEMRDLFQYKQNLNVSKSVFDKVSNVANIANTIVIVNDVRKLGQGKLAAYLMSSVKYTGQVLGALGKAGVAASKVKGVANTFATLKTSLQAGLGAVGKIPSPPTFIAWAVGTIILETLGDLLFEYLSNKNVCTLLPLWWEGYPFVAGVKDGEHILLIPGISNATEENTGEYSTGDIYSEYDDIENS